MPRTSRSTSTTVALVLLVASVAPVLHGEPPSVIAAKSVLLDYDRAFAAQDHAAIVATISPNFGCELYGGLSASELSRSLEFMFEELKDTRCATSILRIEEADESSGLVQAYVSREYRQKNGSATSEPIETQNLVLYLKPEAGSEKNSDRATQIIALEEFDPACLACIESSGAKRFVDKAAGLSFSIPSDLLVVAGPRFSSVARLLLRTPDLKGEIRIVLDLLPTPYELEPALDFDLREWTSMNTYSDVRVRRTCKVADHPAIRAEATYRGAACQLQPNSEKKLARDVVRVYAQLDSDVLFAAYLDCDAHIAERIIPKLDTILDSLRLENSAAFGLGLKKRLGYGVIENGRFFDPRTGFSLRVPPGYTLDRSPSANCFCLTARAPATTASGIAVRIEGIEPLEPEHGPSELAEFDDEAFRVQVSNLAGREARIAHERATIGKLSGVRVDRGSGSASDPIHVAFYVKQDRYLIVFDVTAKDTITARTALEAVVCSSKF